MALNPKSLANVISKKVELPSYDPFLYDYDEDKMDVNYDKGESHLPSEYEPGYKEMEDDNFSGLSFYPTKKQGVVYVDSDQWGRGFSTPENIAKYIKESYPYNRQEWERERRGK